MITTLKTCFKCGAEKPRTEFYKHSKMADGHLNKCKLCTKIDVKERRRTDPKVQEYDRKRGSRQSKGYLKEYREKYPNKYKAHNKVNNALRGGKITKPDKCSCCDSDFAVVAHHDDYLKPLEVRWLCQICHLRWHSEHGEALNAS